MAIELLRISDHEPEAFLRGRRLVLLAVDHPEWDRASNMPTSPTRFEAQVYDAVCQAMEPGFGEDL